MSIIKVDYGNIGGGITPKECIIAYTVSNGWYSTASDENGDYTADSGWTGEYIKAVTSTGGITISAVKPCKVVYKEKNEILKEGNFTTDEQILVYRYGSGYYSSAREYAMAMVIE